MTTSLRKQRTVDTQKIESFTGEGAYHGSTKPRPTAPTETLKVAPPQMVEEMRPTTVERYTATGATSVGAFAATFANLFEIVDTLPVPTQDQIMNDGITFCWCPFADALREAGPLTKRVLTAMQKHLLGTKRNIYVDAKIQYFQAGDVPVDSRHWHVDGSITARGPEVQRLGLGLAHDMRARHARPELGPQLLAYQSSDHCATQFATAPVTITLPELIPNFDELDQKIRALDMAHASQPASSIVRFDGLSLHRAVAAKANGWRLWVRVMETDREVQLSSSLIECYGTVFRT